MTLEETDDKKIFQIDALLQRLRQLISWKRRGRS